MSFKAGDARGDGICGALKCQPRLSSIGGGRGAGFLYLAGQKSQSIPCHPLYQPIYIFDSPVYKARCSAYRERHSPGRHRLNRTADASKSTAIKRGDQGFAQSPLEHPHLSSLNKRESVLQAGSNNFCWTMKALKGVGCRL